MRSMRKKSTKNDHQINLRLLVEKVKSTSLKYWMIVLLMITISLSAQAQCPLICNKNVNISMDEDCLIEVTPDMILEGEGTLVECLYEVVIMGSNGVPIPGSPFLNSSHVGKTFQVKILSDHNSCWGTILVEDKFPPMIDCPEPITINCYDKRTFSLPSASDNCGIVTEVTEISNEVEDIGCTGPFSAIRRITYQAKDKSGNLSSVCTRLVYYAKVNLDSIMFPLNRDNIEASALDCDNAEGWDLNGNKYPDINETGKPKTFSGFEIHPNASYCELNTTYVDQEIKICGASKKIFRTWTVMDWCSGRIATDIQIIKITDDEGPQGTINIEGLQIPADAYTCKVNWKVPAPTNITDCSPTFYTVAYVVADAYGVFPFEPIYTDANIVKMGNMFTINNLMVGKVRIRYKLEDECGNFTYKYGDIMVVDKTAPNVICDEHTIVSLNNNGTSYIDAITLDDGSFDRCTDIKFDARRMDNGCNTNNTIWTERVYFCCADVGKDIMVSLRVTDTYGNFNTCMVIVRVQDKINPKITCPPDITLDCGVDIENFTITGKATAIDNCANPNIYKKDSLAVNQCGIGMIWRKWFAEDRNGSKDSCIQKITIRGLDPLDYDDVIWHTVRDTIIDGCMDIDTDPKYTGYPKWLADSCRLIGSNYKDQIFEQVDGVCFKILRVWTIIDWCNYDQNYPDRYKYNYTQVIKVTNHEPPVFLTCQDTVFCTYESTCNGFIQFTAKAKDVCTPDEKLVWSYELDLYNNGTIDSIGNDNDISGNYPVGRHRVIWLVKDGCGNVAKCDQIFYVKDCKKPTPYCLGEITTVLMPKAGFIDTWARDFDQGSFDNCGGKLRFSFSQNVLDTGRRFTCSELGINQLQVWVTDTTGNQDFCSVRIMIQDNSNVCNTGGGFNIKGAVFTENNFQVKNVDISLEDMSTNAMKYTIIDGSGEFTFNNLPNSSYMVKANKTNEHLLGINTIDLVRIQRHILAVTKLDSPYKLIAADVTNDRKITVDDIVMLRKLILGVKTTFDVGTGWRFVPMDMPIANPQNPWPIKEEIYITDASQASSPIGFKTIKVGDVDGSAFNATSELSVTNRSQSSLPLELNYKNTSNTSGVDFIAMQDIEINGFQMEIKIPNGMEVLGVESAYIDLKRENYYINFEASKLAVVWHDLSNRTIERGRALFSIITKPTQALSGISVDENRIAANAYNANEIYTLKLFNKAKEVNDFMVLQNNPNPFSDRTSIQYYLPNKGLVKVRLFDIDGRILYSSFKSMNEGWNEEKIDVETIDKRGLIYYEIEFNGHKEIKKMLII